MLAIVVCQLWNLFRLIKRTDVEGSSFFSSPYELRHGAKSCPIELGSCPMPGQSVSYVPAPVQTQASMKVGPRGVDAIFIGFSESHGVIDNSAMLIPLEPLLTGIGSIALLRTRDYKITSPEASSPLARLRE